MYESIEKFYCLQNQTPYALNVSAARVGAGGTGGEREPGGGGAGGRGGAGAGGERRAEAVGQHRPRGTAQLLRHQGAGQISCDLILHKCDNIIFAQCAMLKTCFSIQLKSIRFMYRFKEIMYKYMISYVNICLVYFLPWHSFNFEFK